VFFNSNKVFVIFNDAIILAGEIDNEGLYAMSHSTSAIALSTTATTAAATFEQLHVRLGHLHPGRMKLLLRNESLTGLVLKGPIPAELNCEVCSAAKMPRPPFAKHKDWGARSAGQVLHSDVCGKISPSSLGGNNYFILIVDDFSEFQFVKTVARKSEAADFIMATRKSLSNIGYSVAKLVTDGGGEFNSNAFEAYLTRKGILHSLTSPYTPQLNAKAERANRTVIEIVRCLLKQSGLPAEFWGEAVSHAVFLHNRLPTTNHPDSTPFERLYKRKPSAAMMQPLGKILHARHCHGMGLLF
jgi:hypothetical protein